MPAYKEKDRSTWTVKIKHKNWSGKIKWVTKRGFATKREALQYERDFLARKSGDLDMSFADFVQVYREERGARIKESTLSIRKWGFSAFACTIYGTHTCLCSFIWDTAQWRSQSEWATSLSISPIGTPSCFPLFSGKWLLI